jgi:hypothetical protein
MCGGGWRNSVFELAPQDLPKELSEQKGSYVNVNYPEARRNDWHYVELTVSGYGFRWTNKAKRSWSLTLRGGQNLKSNVLYFDVSKDCPYYNKGYKTAKMTIEAHQTTLIGPGNESYIKSNSITTVFTYKERLVLLTYIQWHFKLVT